MKNESAPFTGVLIPEYTYIKLDDLDSENEILTRRFQECIDRENDRPASINFESYALSFSLGVLATLFVTHR